MKYKDFSSFSLFTRQLHNRIQKPDMRARCLNAPLQAGYRLLPVLKNGGGNSK
jgi:hypothetical protein